MAHPHPIASDAGPGRSILFDRAFMLFWGSRGFSSMAVQMQAVALGWQIYALTGRPLDLGLVGLAQFLPALLLTLPAGDFADRYRRREILKACRLVETVAAAVLCLGSLGGWLDAAWIYGMALLFGAARAFEFPASQAMLPALVPRASFGRAVAWNSMIGQTATIVGPALGGLLYVFGPATVHGVCAGLFVISALGTAMLPHMPPVAGGERRSLSTVTAGLAFIFREKALLGALSLDLFAVLLGGAVALMPIYARDILQVGPLGLGLLQAAPAAGAVGTALILARHPLQRHCGPIMFAGVAVFGAATCVFALSRDFALSLAALASLGAGDMLSVFVRLALVQLRTPDAMRGRVSAVNAIFIGTSNWLGAFESGATAALFGTVPAALIGGIGTLAAAALWLVLFPDLRRVDRLEAAG